MADLSQFVLGTDPMRDKNLKVISADLIERSVARMDKVQSLADAYIIKCTNDIDFSYDYLKHVFRKLITGETTPDIVRKELNDLLAFYQDAKIINEPIDELNILSQNKTKVAAFRAAVAVQREICKQKNIKNFLSTCLILAEYCVFSPVYDLQLLTGYAFAIDEMVKTASAIYFEYRKHSEYAGRNIDQLFGEIDMVIDEAGYTLNGFAVAKPDIDDAVSYTGYAMNRLIHSEATDITNESQAAVGEFLKIPYYKYITERDSKVCELCSALDGVVLRYRDRRVGENFPPIHPNCRCQHSFELKLASLEHMRELAEIDNKLYTTVPNDMSFEKWLESWGISYDGWQL